MNVTASVIGGVLLVAALAWIAGYFMGRARTRKEWEELYDRTAKSHEAVVKQLRDVMEVCGNRKKQVEALSAVVRHCSKRVNWGTMSIGSWDGVKDWDGFFEHVEDMVQGKE